MKITMIVALAALRPALPYAHAETPTDAKGTIPQCAWTRGDFNADGVIDAFDFIIWNQFKFQSAF